MKKLKQILSAFLAVGMLTFSAPMGVFAEEAGASSLPTGTPVTASGGGYGVTPTVASDVAINIANFPDDIFRSYVSTSFDKNNDNVLSTTEISAVTEIYVYHMGISDLDGIEYFTALTKLDCVSNELTSLDMSENTALTELYCYRNKLGSLDVSENTELSVLYCYDNQLTSLDVSENTELSVLYCDNNQLTSLDVSENTALTELDCSENELTSLDVSENTALTELDCSDNGLTNLDVSENTALTYLSCHNNQLTSLDVSENTALTKLYCYNNPLTNLDVSANTALEHLECPGNQLTSLDVSKNTALTDLYCDNNQLTSLDVSENTELSVLYCGENQLTSLDVSENTELKYLKCYNNQLTSLDVSKNTSLTNLFCDGNTYDIGSVCGSYDLSNLPSDFDVTKASEWNGASCTDGILSGFTVGSDGKFTVTYTYDVSRNKSRTFTLTGTKADHVHVFGTEWKFDSENHWHECSCEERSDVANHTWDNGKVTTEPTYEADGVKTFTCTVCEATKTEAIPKLEKPTEPTTPSKPVDASPNPEIKGENGKTGWSAIDDKIENADKGDVINIDMNGSEILQKNTLDTIAGKDVTIVLDMGNGISWEINGKDVPEGSHSYVDLGIKTNTSGIPIDIINKVTGEKYTMQISLDHNGEFGFTATLYINLGAKNKDLFANLYHYNKPEKKMEFISSAKIDKDGKAALKFTHASDYAIVISDKNEDLTLGAGYEEIPTEPIKFDE